MAKANKDGWIRHRGGKCPVGENERCSVRLRNGNILDLKIIAGLRWNHDGSAGDIMAYRILKPAVSRSVVVESLQDEYSYLLDDADQLKEAGPIQWRDRIESLKDERQRLDAEYQSRVSENESEIADLTSKLAAEGFALIDRINAKLDDLDASLPNHEADMSDWRNWQIGDRVEILSSTNEFWKGREGLVGTVSEFDDGKPVVLFDGTQKWHADDNCIFKFHGRPSK